MTKVLFRIFKPAPNENVPASGTLQFKPTLKRTATDKSVILPVPFTVNVTNGVADVALAPTEPGWAWELYAEGFGVGSWLERILVPDVEEIFYSDLVKVDVSTLDPEVEPEAAWWAEIEKLKPVQGLKGDQGDQGPAGSISEATATTLEPGSLATVTLGGTPEDRLLTFGIPRGDKGDSVKGDKGDDGLSAVISGAEATTLAPGSAATVTLGGTPQDRIFTFGIPRGADGAPGAGGGSSELSGVGYPNGVVTASLGAIYNDTNSTKGAMKWIKTTSSGNTGWRVLYGDTGEVVANISMNTGYQAKDGYSSSRVYLHRTPSTIRFQLIDFIQFPTATSGYLFTMPTGYRPTINGSFKPQPGYFPIATSGGTQLGEIYVDRLGQVFVRNWAAVTTQTPSANIYGEFLVNQADVVWP
jgi:hypothetical protein